MSDEKQETIADIVADIRERAENAMRNGERLVHNEAVANMLTFVADRIEAAWKREREVVEADALFVGGVVEAARHEPVGNAAAMRDIVTALANVILPPRGKADEDGWLAWVRAMQTKARAALADATTENSSAVGNAAAMHEVLVKIRRELNDYCNGSTLLDRMTEDPPDYTCLRDSLLEIERIVDAALSVPPRNCDRFADELDAQLAFLNEVWLISVDREEILERDKYENWTDEMRTRYGRWLLAPVAERKGEGDGR